ncbi:hypothetical protein Tco_0674902 [Tanacetum coccineum]
MVSEDRVLDRGSEFVQSIEGAQGDCEAEVFQVNNDVAEVAQRWLEDKQPEEKINMDYLVKELENIHLGIKVGANITVFRVPGQKGVEDNVAEKKKVEENSFHIKDELERES